MNELVVGSVHEVKGIRLPITIAGLLAGFGTGYLVCYLIHAFADPPMYYWSLMDMLLPFAVLGMLSLVLWARKPLPARDAFEFAFYFWIPFLFLYLAAHYVYWAPKI